MFHCPEIDGMAHSVGWEGFIYVFKFTKFVVRGSYFQIVYFAHSQNAFSNHQSVIIPPARKVSKHAMLAGKGHSTGKEDVLVSRNMSWS